MSKIAEYVMDKVDAIADKTGYDSDFLFNQVITLAEDGQSLESAIKEVDAIATEQDY